MLTGPDQQDYRPDFQVKLDGELYAVFDAKEGMERYVGPGGRAQEAVDLYQNVVSEKISPDVPVVGVFRHTERGGAETIYAARAGQEGTRFEFDPSTPSAGRLPGSGRDTPEGGDTLEEPGFEGLGGAVSVLGDLPLLIYFIKHGHLPPPEYYGGPVYDLHNLA